MSTEWVRCEDTLIANTVTWELMVRSLLTPCKLSCYRTHIRCHSDCHLTNTVPCWIFMLHIYLTIEWKNESLGLAYNRLLWRKKMLLINCMNLVFSSFLLRRKSNPNLPVSLHICLSVHAVFMTSVIETLQWILY